MEVSNQISGEDEKRGGKDNVRKTRTFHWQRSELISWKRKSWYKSYVWVGKGMGKLWKDTNMERHHQLNAIHNKSQEHL